MPRQLEDRQGRNVVMLVESIRDSMPVNAALVSRRMALELLDRNGIKVAKKQGPKPTFAVLASIGESKGIWPFRK